MFDKEKFSDILIKIKDLYGSVRKFSDICDFNRNSISLYINKKPDSPPTPKILQKIADASKGITTYRELMIICGYINFESEQEKNSDLDVLNKIRDEVKLMSDKQSNIKLTDEEAKQANVYIYNSIKNIIENKATNDPNKMLKIIVTTLAPLMSNKNLFLYCVRETILQYTQLLQEFDNDKIIQEFNLNRTIDVSDLSDEEIIEVRSYIDYLKSKRKNK